MLLLSAQQLYPWHHKQGRPVRLGQPFSVLQRKEQTKCSSAAYRANQVFFSVKSKPRGLHHGELRLKAEGSFFGTNIDANVEPPNEACRSNCTPLFQHYQGSMQVKLYSTFSTLSGKHADETVLHIFNVISEACRWNCTPHFQCYQWNMQMKLYSWSTFSMLVKHSDETVLHIFNVIRPTCIFGSLPFWGIGNF